MEDLLRPLIVRRDSDCGIQDRPQRGSATHTQPLPFVAWGLTMFLVFRNKAWVEKRLPKSNSERIIYRQRNPFSARRAADTGVLSPSNKRKTNTSISWELNQALGEIHYGMEMTLFVKSPWAYP